MLKSLSVRGISSDAVEYPYYENAARLAENHLAIRLIPEGILLGVPIISLLILLLLLNRKRTWGLHSIRDAVENAIDRKHQRDYYETAEPQPDWDEDWPEDWENDDPLPYDGPEDAYGESEDYGAYDADEPPEPFSAPPKSKAQRRRERRAKRRRAKRRRQARRRAGNNR